MINLPNYLACFKKFVCYLGLEYSETQRETGKFRKGALRDFIKLGESYTDDYLPQILSLFAGEDPEKRNAIKVCLIISENLARFITSKNYYTIASNKRAIWALLIFYYIPHLACLLSNYMKDFEISEYLIKHDFMLPHLEEGKFISPTAKLREYLIPIKDSIKGIRDNETNVLAVYLYKLDPEVTPSYKTKQKIINQLKTLPELKEEVDEIETIFHVAIVVSRICHDLEELFGNKVCMLSLVDYFKKCLATSNRLIQGDESYSLFKDFIGPYVDFYRNEFVLTATELNNLFPVKLNEAEYDAVSYEDRLEIRDDYRDQICIAFESFLYTTTSATQDQLDEIDTENFTKGILRFSRLTEAESIDDVHEEIVERLTELEYIFSSPEKPLQESRIIEILSSIKRHKYHSIYEHEFLYYSSLSALAKNDFLEALEKLNLASQRCKLVTAGETQDKIAKLLIILRLIMDDSLSYDHLNAEIRMIIESEDQNLELTPYPEQYHGADNIEKNLRRYTSKENYLAKIMDEITCFNTKGYCKYEGVNPIKYNPFEKVDDLIYDIYDCYTKMDQTKDSKSLRMQRVINKLMRSSKPDYSINKNLVTLHQYKAAEVFDEITFSSIAFFCAMSNINAPNIIKLAYDRETLTLISKAINTPGRSRS
ncbi:hypothetical protein [Candidatus Methylomicrobium oryzae]|uniref:hypothetical protein n=1 Tax=Candidatus Methylomicrobium oryzae TaxID=2802053 RepID=UPI001920E164|nr:hypothetical protein [Methylomicrobium sp. RS1]MBL1265500.1 hypothetical protein [Methylomicrobium sp. RS1]